MKTVKLLTLLTLAGFTIGNVCAQEKDQITIVNNTGLGEITIQFSSMKRKFLKSDTLGKGQQNFDVPKGATSFSASVIDYKPNAQSTYTARDVSIQTGKTYTITKGSCKASVVPGTRDCTLDIAVE